MREISKRANVAPKTLYNAVGDRDRLIGFAIREVYDAVRQNVQFRTSDRTLEGLLDRAIVLNRGNLKARNYAQAVATIYFSPSTNPYLRSLLQEMAVGNTREWLEDVRAKGGLHDRSEERRVGKRGSVRVDIGGRRIIKKKNIKTNNMEYK